MVEEKTLEVSGFCEMMAGARPGLAGEISMVVFTIAPNVLAVASLAAK